MLHFGPDLGTGEKVLYQRGIPGFHVVRYRVVQDGAYTTRERFEDNYPATSQLWKVGPKKESYSTARTTMVLSKKETTKMVTN